MILYYFKVVYNNTRYVLIEDSPYVGVWLCYNIIYVWVTGIRTDDIFILCIFSMSGWLWDRWHIWSLMYIHKLIWFKYSEMNNSSYLTDFSYFTLIFMCFISCQNHPWILILVRSKCYKICVTLMTNTTKNMTIMSCVDNKSTSIIIKLWLVYLRLLCLGLG